MKANSLVIGGELRSRLSDCKVGETKSITVTVSVTSASEDEVHGTITAVEGYESPMVPAKKKGRGPKALYDAIES